MGNLNYRAKWSWDKTIKRLKIPERFINCSGIFVYHCLSLRQRTSLSPTRQAVKEWIENEKLLLRMFNLEEFESKRTEYSILERMKDYNVTCSKPISIGEVGNRGYMITSYIEGKDAKDEIPKYSYQEQFNIGIEAGKELRKMHQYPAPNHVSSWYSRKVKKHKKYIDAYYSLEL